MATNYGKTNIGIFRNYNFETGSKSGFSPGTSAIYDGESQDDIEGSRYSLRCYSIWSSATWNDDWVPIDTSKTWTLSYRVRTLNQQSVTNQNMYAYLGFTTWDSSKRFIDLRNCGGIANTYLSRALNVGDAYAYVQSNSGWYTGDPYYFRNFCVYPPTHPEFYEPHRYTRIGYGDYNMYYSGSPELQPEGDYRLKLAAWNGSSLVDTTWNYSAHATPAGTPVMNGQAGGTYNYTFGARFYSTSWTTVASTFTGESRNSSAPFRFATRYIRAMVLFNYARPAQSGTYPYAEALFDRMLFLENPSDKNYRFK